MKTNNITKLFLIVHGNIQGVGYRAFVQTTAKKYNIRGIARNVSNGSVEILAIGSKENINQFIKEINISTKYGASVFNIEKSGEENLISDLFGKETINQNDFIIEKTRIIKDN